MSVKLRPSDKAWIVLWTYVFTYNALARRGERLSEGCDRYLSHRYGRWLTEAVMALFYMHLSNRIPDRYDPICWLLARPHDETSQI